MVDSIAGALVTAANALAKPAAGAAATGAAGGENFAELVRDVANKSIDASNLSGNLSAKALVREAELVDIVTAVSNAEVTLETVMAVRDRVIAAYQEIIKMPI